MQFEIDVVIPEDRRLVIQLPPDFPVGRQRIQIRFAKLPVDSKAVMESDIHPIFLDKPEDKTA